MDRFIDQATKLRTSLVLHLKSNMDRFIVIPHLQLITFYIYLKSNMDRFIVGGCNMLTGFALFKIQYG